MSKQQVANTSAVAGTAAATDNETLIVQLIVVVLAKITIIIDINTNNRSSNNNKTKKIPTILKKCSSLVLFRFHHSISPGMRCTHTYQNARKVYMSYRLNSYSI